MQLISARSARPNDRADQEMTKRYVLLYASGFASLLAGASFTHNLLQPDLRIAKRAPTWKTENKKADAQEQQKGGR